RVERARRVEPNVAPLAPARRKHGLEARYSGRVGREGGARDVRSGARLRSSVRVEANAPRDRREAGSGVKGVRRIRLERLRGEHAADARRGGPGGLRQGVEERAPEAGPARAGSNDEGAHFAREGRGRSEAVPFEPALDLSAWNAAALGDEVDVAAEQRGAAADAGVVVEADRELGINGLVARAGVAAPVLVGVPELVPERGDGEPLAGNRSAHARGHRARQGGHRSASPSGKSTSTRSRTRPCAGAVVPARRRSRDSSARPTAPGSRRPRPTSIIVPTRMRTMLWRTALPSTITDTSREFASCSTSIRDSVRTV